MFSFEWCILWSIPNGQIKCNVPNNLPFDGKNILFLITAADFID